MNAVIKKYIALFFITVLFVPITIQVHHAFENHHHTVCVSKTDQHYHQKELDCSELHKQLQSFTNTFLEESEEVVHYFCQDTFHSTSQLVKCNYYSSNESRAPPLAYV